jgi:CcmD family protein
METFIAAYLIIWLAVTAYVAMLGVRQRRLAALITSLHSQMEKLEAADQPVSKAA